MKFKLIEEFLDERVLNETTEPQYKNIILELIYYITPVEELKRLIENSRGDLEFHHIDAMYEYIVRVSKTGKSYKIGKAINNKPQNIAIATKEAHAQLTEINTEIKKRIQNSGKKPEEAIPEILDKFDEQLKKYRNQIFPLIECLPANIVQSLSTITDD